MAMAMEISASTAARYDAATESSGSDRRSRLSHGERLKEGEALERAGRAEETENGQSVRKASGQWNELRDTYISSEKSGAKASGLYRLEQDEEGKRKIVYDAPQKNTAKKNTANTDQVEREIRELKEKRRQLEQQIRSAGTDRHKAGELEKKLAQVESEISRKDNDTYRRQHVQFS